jgi:hypothetical protein
VVEMDQVYGCPHHFN